MKHPLRLLSLAFLLALVSACAGAPPKADVFPKWDDIKSAAWVDYGRLMDEDAAKAVARFVDLGLMGPGEAVAVQTRDGLVIAARRSAAMADKLWAQGGETATVAGHEAKRMTRMKMVMFRPQPDTLVMVDSEPMAKRVMEGFEGGSPFPGGDREGLLAAVKIAGHHCELHHIGNQLVGRCLDQAGKNGKKPDELLNAIRADLDKRMGADKLKRLTTIKYLDEGLSSMKREDGWVVGRVVVPDGKAPSWFVSKAIKEVMGLMLMRALSGGGESTGSGGACAQMETKVCAALADQARCDLVKTSLERVRQAKGAKHAETGCSLVLEDPAAMEATIKGFKSMPLK